MSRIPRAIKSRNEGHRLCPRATAGKTTIIRYVRERTDLPVLEMEEEFLRIHGRYPEDNSKRSNLIRQVFEAILTRDEILFFCNVDFLNNQDIQRARAIGFIIVQLDINLDTMLARNAKRVAEEGYPDTSQYFLGMLKYQQKLRESKLVDAIVNADQPTQEVVKDLLDTLAASS